MVGARRGHPHTPMTPHNMTMCLTGNRNALGRVVWIQRRKRAGSER